MNVMAKTETKSEAIASKFTKEQICSSVKYSKHKDVLSYQLKDGTLYTFDAVDKIIDEFMKGKVK